MPEYLAPGVYVEETSFRAKPIEGVSTTTTAFIGPTRDGPIFVEPPLLTSFQEFQRIYGGMDPLQWEPATNYVAQAVRAFFEEGGQRLYVARMFKPASGSFDDEPALVGAEWSDGIARWDVGDDPASHPTTPADALAIRARYPGAAGNRLVTFIFHVDADVVDHAAVPVQLKGVSRFDVVWVQTNAEQAASQAGQMYWVDPYVDSQGLPAYRLRRDDPADATPGAGTIVDLGTVAQARPITVSVEIVGSPSYRGRFDVPVTLDLLTFHPAPLAPAPHHSLFDELAEPPAPSRVELYAPIAIRTASLVNGVEVAELLAGRTNLDLSGSVHDAIADQVLNGGRMNLDSPPRLEPVPIAALTTRLELKGGNDGVRPTAAGYPGYLDVWGNKSGLLALEDLEDVSIVGAPGSTAAGGEAPWDTQMRAITGYLLAHCERMKYRVAVLDSPDGVLPGDIRDLRAKLDSKYGALYYPWVVAFDPVTETDVALPPSGFVTGIYARSDIARGVHKAPANEVVRLATGLELAINRSQQEALNPVGVNCLRLLEGRGYRVWGARTITSDPEWRYVNLRRNWCYLGRSIELGTQWAVFEPNAEELWGNIRRAVEDFLFNEWKSGRLMGVSPDEAYFVRCDRTTMTQSDIDNGRMICLVGVALLRPAEFVIFRIGQKTIEFKAA